MKSGKLLAGVAFVLAVVILGSAQTQPNLENGYKPYGSYDGSPIDAVNTLAGTLVVDINAPFQSPQRGSLVPRYAFYSTSKNWSVQCVPDTQASTGLDCQWTPGVPAQCVMPWQNAGSHRQVCAFPSGVGLTNTLAITVKRTAEVNNTGYNIIYDAFGYSLVTWDLAVHQLYPVPGTADSTGEATQFETVDGTGYHVQLSGNSVTVTDRAGSQYQGTFPDPGTCVGPSGGRDPWDGIKPGSLSQAIMWAPYANGAGGGSGSDYFCGQLATFTTVTDRNGNVFNLDTGTDTLGRTQPTPPSSSDTSDCVSPLPISHVGWYDYVGANGVTNPIKLCFSSFAIATNFSQPGVMQAQGYFSPSLPGTPALDLVATVVLPDHSKWTLNYDSYGEIIYLGLPLGGSISYTWTEIGSQSCANGDETQVSRAVASRTVNDNNGHSFTWNYQWGAVANGTRTNTVTSPLGDDTVHIFTALDGAYGCSFFETRTLDYQGTGAARQLLKQVDTTYSSAALPMDDRYASGAGNVVPTSAKTTIYPSGRVSLVTKVYDAGLGANAPIFGNVVAEKDYDWGEGAPGGLLREIDKTYQWQLDSRYLTAHMLDAPASEVVKDASGNRAAEMDYTYDEPQYLAAYSSVTQHGAPPSAVRGNLTTVNRWLNTSNSFITSHTNWYDTGEVYQQVDPLGHATTHSYDAAYVGAYSTKTCNALNQCVSGTYDFNTGLLTSFTDANASSQASGNTPGDSNHTSNYSYDLLSRLMQAQMPPDPSGNRSQTTFTYSNPNVFPLNVQRQKSITTTMNDVSTSYFDGLGRPYKTQHATPGGTVTVSTTFDALDHVTQITNPYYSSNDTTYGVIQTQYDGLGRATQTTEQDGSVASVSYLDNCTITTDEAGKQRRACSNALGQLTSVDEPGDSSAGASPVANGGGTGATGSVTISGSEQSKTIPASGGGGSGTGCSPGTICDGGGGGGGGPTTIYDAGSVSLTVNGHVDSAGYGQNDTAGTIAANLATAVNQDQYAVVTANASGATVNLTSRATGSQVSYSLSVSWTWDRTDFTGPSFTATTLGSVSGGTDGPAIFSGHAYTTLYTYDALGNLLTVTQQGGTSDQTKWRVRTFTYDSVSRLLSANNPESGTITYTYDADSDLLTKTDARGVTTTYAYDQLHRLTTKTYSDTATPASSFVYDQSNPWGWSTLGNPIGRLVAVNTGGSSGTSRVFSYDALGRQTTEWQCQPSCPAVSAQYNLAGELTSLTYPSGRTVKFGYNSAAQLDQVTYDNWNGNAVGYSYWSVNDTSFLANGTPKLATLGNGVTEATTLNKRLQLQEETVTNSTIGILADHAYSYGTQNNGNILSAMDQLNPARTQTFTYDPLNRLATANESRWGLSFVYDPWGNRLQQNVTAGSAGGSNLTVDNRNRIMGANSNCTSATTYCYDLAGNLLNDSFHKYAFDAESRISTVDNGGATYTYDADGDRVRKDISGGPSTIYFYFGGQAVAELDVANNYWTDYVSAGGKRIAKADTFVNMARMQGTCSTPSSGCKSTFWFRNSGLVGYKIQSGDKLFILQNVMTGAAGGPGLTYKDANGNVTQGDTISNVFDQNGCPMNQDCASGVNAYRFRRMDLTPLAGMTIADDPLVETTWTSSTSGNWEALWADYVLVGADGTVHPIFAGTAWGQSITLASSNQAGTSNVLGFVDKELCWTCAALTTNFYHDDQIGSSRLLTAGGGWPVWQGTFLPYGEEYNNPQITPNHYKFTGKERDNESGLDYFGARYYANTLGRFLTPDWAVSPEPVPYADLFDPQSLNQYSYVRNIPTVRVDPNGHDVWTFVKVTVTVTLSYLGERMHKGFVDIGHFMTSGPPHGVPTLPGICTCPPSANQNQNNNNKDNNNSYQQNTKADQMKSNAEKGAASEKKILNDKGLTKNTEKVSGSEGKAIPDSLTKKESLEVKDAARVTDSKQLRVEQEAAQNSGRTNTLVTGTNTRVSPTAQRRFDKVERRPDLGPKEQK